MKQPLYRQYIQVSLAQRPIFSRLNERLKINCQKEALEYSKCIQTKGLNIQEHECQETFEKFLICLKAK